MSDTFTTTTRQSWFSRIISSFVGILFGIWLFFGSFFILFLNEGRVDFWTLAEKAPLLKQTDSPTPEYSGKLVAIEWDLTTRTPLWDTFLKPNTYLLVKRNVETYAWKEDEKTETHKDIGGSETTTKTYTYEKKWLENPESSSRFQVPTGHTNITSDIKNTSFTNGDLKVGDYSLSSQWLFIEWWETLTLNTENTLLTGSYILENNYIYKSVGTWTLSNPEIGDIRISYHVIISPLTNTTSFWQLDTTKKSLQSYQATKYRSFYEVRNWNRWEAATTLHQEHTMIQWLLRLAWFLCMFAGLSLVVWPISVFFDVLPFLGTVSRSILWFINFFIALALSTVTIIVWMIFYNIYALIVVILITLWVIGYFLNKKYNTNSQPQSTTPWV